MRWLAPLLLVILSGCVQSQNSLEGPDDCVMFCSEHESTVHFDWVVPLVGVLFVILVVGLIIAIVAGREDGQQQQVVVHIDRDGDVRQR